MSSRNEESPTKDKKMRELIRAAEKINNQWEGSGGQKYVVEVIKTFIFPLDSICVDSALCLGLGSMTLPEDPSTPARKGVRRAEDGKPRVSRVGRGERIDQLLLFETVLMTLREKFTISSARFQDPTFTELDHEFLEARGHTVVRWNPNLPSSGSRCTMDLSLLEFCTSSTMCYLPSLDAPVIVEVVSWVQPSLYLGHNLVASTMRRMFYGSEQTKHLMDRYSDIVLSSDFEDLGMFGGDIEADKFGFMWPADVKGSQEIAERLQKRNERILNEEVDFATKVYNSIDAATESEKEQQKIKKKSTKKRAAKRRSGESHKQ